VVKAVFTLSELARDSVRWSVAAVIHVLLSFTSSVIRQKVVNFLFVIGHQPKMALAIFMAPRHPTERH
jgi:hypothetical protein